MSFEVDVFVSYVHTDDRPWPGGHRGWVADVISALRLRLSQILERPVLVHDAYDDRTLGRIQRSATFVSIVSPGYVESEPARLELHAFIQASAEAGALTGTRLFKVLKSPVPLEQQPAELQALLGYQFFSLDPETSKAREFNPHFGPEAAQNFWLRVDDLAQAIASSLKQMEAMAPADASDRFADAELRPPAAPRAPAPAAAPAAPQRTKGRRPLEPVWLGVSAPHAAKPGGTFVARFVAYVDDLSDLVAQQLRGLDASDEARAVLGLSPDRARWRIGTPVTVRVGGPHLQATPPTRTFEWSGRQNLLSFVVEVEKTALLSQLVLSFEVFIAGVSVAFIPMTLAIGGDQEPIELDTKSQPVASTAFASYASGDAPSVAACLSALKHWDPALDVFMDCLDLTPNAEWQRELEQVIPTKDAFLLFWSANASRSPWVAWELQHAKATKGLGWIRPMPLDDPAVTPPPDDLKQLQFGDRFLIARQAFLQRPPNREEPREDLVYTPIVYLIYDERDAAAIGPWSDLLFKDFEVAHPPFAGDEREIREADDELLRTCDAVVIFYGAGNEAWLRRKLMKVEKAGTTGRVGPAPFVGICLIPPKTHEKERFRTHAATVIPLWDGVPSERLQSLVARIWRRAPS